MPLSWVVPGASFPTLDAYDWILRSITSHLPPPSTIASRCDPGFAIVMRRPAAMPRMGVTTSCWPTLKWVVQPVATSPTGLVTVSSSSSVSRSGSLASSTVRSAALSFLKVMVSLLHANVPWLPAANRHPPGTVRIFSDAVAATRKSWAQTLAPANDKATLRIKGREYDAVKPSEAVTLLAKAGMLGRSAPMLASQSLTFCIDEILIWASMRKSVGVV